MEKDGGDPVNICWAFQHLVTFQRYIKSDVHGVPAYGPGQPLKVRFAFSSVLVKDTTGREVLCNVRIMAPKIIKGAMALDPKSKDVFIRGTVKYEVVEAKLPPDVHGDTGYWDIRGKEVRTS